MRSHRVIIKDGEFYKRQHDNSFELFDTSMRRSHGKEEYIAYTINPEHEISVFDHFEIQDGYAHIIEERPELVNRKPYSR